MGFCNGMMIEGGSRWGYDPVWVKNEKPRELRTADDQAVKERDDETDDRQKDNVFRANSGPDDLENQRSVPNSSELVLGM